MQLARTTRAPTDKALNRAIVGMLMVLLIGVPAIGAIYFLDRYHDPGPSYVNREIARLEEAIRKTPNSVDLRLQLGGAYLAAQRYRDAIDQYTEVLKADAGNIAATLGRADTLAISKDMSAAARDYAAVIEARKGSEFAKVDNFLERAYYGLGSIQLQQGQSQQAIDSLTAALTINGTDADALNLLGNAYLKVHEPAKAVDAYSDATQLVPAGWPDPYRGLSEANAATGDSAEAEFAAAMVAFCENRPDEARSRLSALVSGKAAMHAMLGLGLIAESMGNAQTAASWYRQVLQRDPANFNAQNGLNRVSPVASPATTSPASSGGAGS